MSIFNLYKGKDESVRIESAIRQQKENKLINRLRPIPGLTLFSFNTETLEIKKAEIEMVAHYAFGGGVYYERKVQVEKDCYYYQSLNRRNFVKHLKKMGMIP